MTITEVVYLKSSCCGEFDDFVKVWHRKYVILTSVTVIYLIFKGFSRNRLSEKKETRSLLNLYTVSKKMYIVYWNFGFKEF